MASTNTRRGSLSALRAANKERVLSAVSGGPRAQIAIARETGLSAATVTSIVRELTADGLVSTSAGTWSGRRATFVAPASRPSGLVVGISVAHSGVDIALWGPEGTQTLAMTWDDLPGAGESEPDRVAAVLPGIVAGRLVLEATTCFPGWASLPVADRASVSLPSGYDFAAWLTEDPTRPLSDALGVPVPLRNDANMAALAESRLGVAVGVPNVVYLELSRGVGGAFLFEGELFTGDGLMAGELGHVQGSEHGPRCWCGNRGCLELLVGADALVPGIRPLHEPGARLTLDDLIEDVEAGHDLALRIAREAGQDIGFGVAPMMQALNISTLVVGGPLSRCGDALIDPIRETIGRHSALLRHGVTVARATVGPAAMAIGCVIDAASRTSLYSLPEFKSQ